MVSWISNVWEVDSFDDEWVYVNVYRRNYEGENPQIFTLQKPIGTEKLYHPETLTSISCKCFLLFLITLPALLVHLVFYSINALIDSSKREYSWTQIKKAPKAYIGMWLSSIIGIFDPLNGRALFGQIERELRGMDAYPHNYVYHYDRIKKDNLDWTFYLAECFQSESIDKKCNDEATLKFALQEGEFNTFSEANPDYEQPSGYCFC